jgi:DNA-binding IclR family transcriptional regulator
MHSSHSRILQYIRNHPEGVRRREVANAFPDVPLSSVDGILARMRTQDLVYNDGIIGRQGSTWFPRTHNDDEIHSPFPEIAHDLIQELRGIHHEAHELHLAKRLQEIFGE